jgi:phospholipid transport system substrate-binding protein
LRLLLCAPLLSLSLSFSAAAKDAGPTETVKSTVESVLAILQDNSLNTETKKRHIKATISQNFDFRAMSRRVLATNWKIASGPQRSIFTDLFKEVLSNTYWRKISGYQGERIEYRGEKMRSAILATVNTVITTTTVDIPLDYKMYRKDDGGWFAYDVVIEQVSLVRNYRGSFQKIIHQVGIDGLLDQLSTKVARASVGPND